ncbi:hypothetical protein D3C87_2176710 [compost metagenome]
MDLKNPYTPPYLNREDRDPPSVIMRTASDNKGATESTLNFSECPSGIAIESVIITSLMLG